ncbi:protein-L-isoaspartate(D-aspartate) O-methyltransferase [Taylorella equigenitalis]|uniref:Protein-L-isoaspartate O-methyltransferase n=2 Tax=Taylorella equigenitalis TaxID=29575 RepID=A0A654KJ79_TAYEM|nr:protein-L-isoaspartate(D-aspartate) O-methyltransferase [Taylorella equigenitalis]ADU92465.1 Protein-L-isoaspartate O-methyltransferase [Taylorella equigenitalis MCE9]AFN36015.1 protein-l-isoaspartate O-methyltransferase [Taylorella equigenitalis ATCC 35865]ASY30647.1 protein-L-isoaspartate O-methyltransferase [Taylorella equigenitalis]ASY39428.1 protein-L-isoaspartate O-methyltransferase [Taylorella equigenitalis]ASY40941.1 protein-L-isoaspartate O-methyltransferase [Taylorella equigenital
MIKKQIISTNSNTRLSSGSRNIGIKGPSPEVKNRLQKALELNTGLNSDIHRLRMVNALKEFGITNDQRVLDALTQVQRHVFMDPGTRSRAYVDEALPIGYGQTISKPSVVARMISLALQNNMLNRVLEIGTGCGYQAAVLSCIYKEVYSIERVTGLYKLAMSNLAKFIDLPKINITLGDGILGLPKHAPFDAIILAAAGLEVPTELLNQLNIGGILVAPVGSVEQKIVTIRRVSDTNWSSTDYESTRFVPLKSGIQV